MNRRWEPLGHPSNGDHGDLQWWRPETGWQYTLRNPCEVEPYNDCVTVLRLCVLCYNVCLSITQSQSVDHVWSTGGGGGGGGGGERC